MYNYQYSQNQEQLNGWLGRALKRLIVGAASLVDSHTLGIFSFESLALEIGSGGSSFWQRGSSEFGGILFDLENDPRGAYEPTYKEEEILDLNVSNLALLIATLTQQISGIENYNIDNKIEIINYVLLRIEVLKKYYKFNDKIGLSQKALDLRDLIIEILLVPIIKFINSQTLNLPNYEKKSFEKSILKFEILDELDPILTRVVNPFNVTYQIFIPKQITIGNNDTNIDVNLDTNVDTNIDTNTNTNTGDSSTPTDTTGNTTTPTVKKGFSLVTKIGIGFGVGLVIRKLLK